MQFCLIIQIRKITFLLPVQDDLFSQIEYCLSAIFVRVDGMCFSSRYIKEVPFVKYLGHVISADMKDDLDIMRQCRQLYAQGNALARRFHMCSDNVKVTLSILLFFIVHFATVVEVQG